MTDNIKNTSINRYLIAVISAALVMASVYLLLTKIVFSTIDRIEVVYEINNDSILTLKLNHPSRVDPAKPVYAGATRMVSFQTPALRNPDLTIQIGSPSTLRIQTVSLYNAISRSRTILKPQQVADFISANGSETKIITSPDGITIQSVTPNNMVSFKPGIVDGAALSMAALISAVAGLLVFVLVSRNRFSTITAIEDVNRRKHATATYRYELDGIRGLAAILVLLEHTWWRFFGSGSTGVWIFFVLSGYLLSLPFVQQPQRATQINYVITYIFRRLGRIVPMYLVTLILIFGFTDNLPYLINHALFIQAEGHLWTIPQEMFFYLVLPVMVLGLYFLSKISNTILLGVFTLLTTVFLINPEVVAIKLYGYGKYAPPYLGWFMCGMLIAYALEYFKDTIIGISDKHKAALSVFGMVLLFALLGASSSWVLTSLTGLELLLAVDYKATFVVACSILIVIVLVCPGTVLSRFFGFWPLRAVGIVGYSFYLLHPIVIDMVRTVSQQFFSYDLLHGRLFIVAGFVTWLFCLFTYSLIERPFLVRRSSKPD